MCGEEQTEHDFVNLKTCRYFIVKEIVPTTEFDIF